MGRELPLGGSDPDRGVTSMKQEYTTPEIRDWGTVSQLTQTGLTQPGADAKLGSSASSGV
jgi:hypothetical protein